jgi:hypothetical protein
MAQEYTGWDDADYYERTEKQQKITAKKEKMKSTTDCRTEEGITVGLIDSLMAISRVLSQRLKINKRTPAINEALMNLRSDDDIEFIKKS